MKDFLKTSYQNKEEEIFETFINITFPGIKGLNIERTKIGINVTFTDSRYEPLDIYRAVTGFIKEAKTVSVRVEKINML